MYNILNMINEAVAANGSSLFGGLRTACMIDVYLFETRDIDQIEHQLSIGYNDRQRVGNHPKTQATGKWSETVTITGRLIVKSVHTLTPFEAIAKNSTPVRLTLGTGESFKVTIRDISRTKKDFIKEGHFVKQEYKVTLQRYWA